LGRPAGGRPLLVSLGWYLLLVVVAVAGDLVRARKRPLKRRSIHEV
jgi:hypothetical protein